jgi:PAS domain S-box-containing protein
MTPSDKAALEREISELKARLREAEDLLHALTHGKVDAVVVGPDDEKKRVLMLSGAYGRYRRLVEDMRQGAVTVTRDGEIIFANKSLGDLLHVSASELFRKPIRQYVKPSDHPRLETLLSPRTKTREVELSVFRSDGTTREASMSLVADNDDFTTLLVTDLGGSSRTGGEPGPVDVASQLGTIVPALRRAVMTLQASNALGPELRRAVDEIDRASERLLGFTREAGA